MAMGGVVGYSDTERRSTRERATQPLVRAPMITYALFAQ